MKKRKKRGPQPFKPTPAQRKNVALYAAAGMSEPAIAAEIGICQNTLRKHFSEDLTAGRAREMAANLRRLRKAAEGGNVTAMKHLDAKFGLASAEASFNEPAGKTPKLGKKERAQAAAETAGDGTDWGDDLNPGARPN